MIAEGEEFDFHQVFYRVEFQLRRFSLIKKERVEFQVEQLVFV